MLTLYISHSVCSNLLQTAATMPYLFNNFFKLLINNNTKVVLITNDAEAVVEDKNMFNVLFSSFAIRHPSIIKETEFETLELNLFNTGRALVVYENIKKNKISPGNSGVLIVEPTNIDMLKNTLEKLVNHYSFKPPVFGPVFATSFFLPICNLYYQDPYIMGKKTSIGKEVERILEGLMMNNTEYFYNKECRLTIIYSKKKAITPQELQKLKSDLLVKLSVRLKKHYNVELKCEFCEGDYEVHDRLMLSDYFVAQAGNAFTNIKTSIDVFGYLSNFEKYTFIYNELLHHLGGETRLKVIKP